MRVKSAFRGFLTHRLVVSSAVVFAMLYSFLSHFVFHKTFRSRQGQACEPHSPGDWSSVTLAGG
jgi:hypothetical protein